MRFKLLKAILPPPIALIYNNKKGHIMPRYKAIIFDWDGTLVDSCGLILEAHNHVRIHYELEPWTMDDFLGRASQSAREYYPKVFGDKSDEAQRVLYDFVEAKHLDYTQPMQGVFDLLSQLKEQKTPIAIVSNKRHETLLKEISHLKWGGYFDVVIGAGFAPKDKPSPEPLLLAIDRLQLSPADILYVGDTETDLLTAQNAGTDVAFVQTDKLRPDLVERYNPDYVGTQTASLIRSIMNDIVS